MRTEVRVWTGFTLDQLRNKVHARLRTREGELDERAPTTSETCDLESDCNRLAGGEYSDARDHGGFACCGLCFHAESLVGVFLSWVHSRLDVVVSIRATMAAVGTSTRR